jgi:putative transposase
VLLVADRWYPSSKTCSAGGAVKTKLSLAERTCNCEHCGLVIDRDHNASVNAAARGQDRYRQWGGNRPE